MLKASLGSLSPNKSNTSSKSSSISDSETNVSIALLLGVTIALSCWAGKSRTIKFAF